MRRGFTLIELLVVIGIFGILLSIFLVGASGARQSGRDNRRVADLKAVQQGLQLYNLKCGMFPGRYDAISGCVGGTTASPGPDKGPSDWATFAATLSGAPIGFGETPSDPLEGASYNYWVQLGNPAAPTPRAQCYVLRATLETDHQVFKEDLDDSHLISSLTPQPPSCTQVGCKELYPASIPDCDDAPGSNYCIGNVECFHGF